MKNALNVINAVIVTTEKVGYDITQKELMSVFQN